MLIPARGSKDIGLDELESGCSKSDRRKVSGTCIICLSPYSAGDVVAWSANKKCPHVFHRKCVLKWLVNKASLDCPCCRENFVYDV